MRKLSAIMLALLLVSGVAMAQDVTVSGSFDWTTQYSETATDTADYEQDLKFTAVVDEYNTAVLKLEEEVTTALVMEIDEAYFTTDWLGAFGVDAPVDVMTKVGLFEADNQEYDVTGIGLEDVDNLGGEGAWYQLVISAMDMVSFQVSIDPSADNDSATNSMAIIGVYGGVDAAFGSINAEVMFSDNSDTAGFDEGAVLVGLGYAGEVVPDMVDLGAALEFEYQLDDAAPDWLLGVGVSGTVMDLATLGISLIGNSEAAAGAMGVDFGLGYMDLVAFDLGVVLNLSEDYGTVDQETLDYLEASVAIMPGASEFRVGYQSVGDGITNGWDTDYKAGAKALGESNIFIRTKISF